MTIDRTKLKQMHDLMAQEGYTQDYATFEKKFTGNDNYANRKKVFDLFSQNGADVGKTYDEFMQRLQTKPQQKTKQPSKPQTAAQMAMSMGGQKQRLSGAPKNASPFVQNLYAADNDKRSADAAISKFATMSAVGVPLGQLGRSIGMKSGVSKWGNAGRAVGKIGLEAGKTYMESMGMYLGSYVTGDMGWAKSTLVNMKEFLASDKEKSSQFMMTDDERSQIMHSYHDTMGHNKGDFSAQTNYITEFFYTFVGIKPI